MRRYNFLIVLFGFVSLIGVVCINLFGRTSQTKILFPPLSFLLQKQSSDYASSKIREEIPTPTQMNIPILTLKNIPIPQKLRIPKLGIQSVVEQVGMTETGNMEVPENAANVGWYKEGTVPSEKGNAVITGHFDTPSGKPAVFYRLYDLSIGDTVSVEYTDGSHKMFIVTGKDFIHLDVFPTQYVFNEKYGHNLNLITCGGVWDPQEKNYKSRAVIYTTLKGTQFDAL